MAVFYNVENIHPNMFPNMLNDRDVLNVARLSEADRYQPSQFCQAVERKCLAIVKKRRQEQDSFEG